MRTSAAGILFALLVELCSAGGHLNSFGTQPVRYRTTSPLVYRIDLGPLGMFADTSAQRLVVEGFQAWENVATAVITFSRGANLPVNVDHTNYSTYYKQWNDGINPIIFDHDGEIIDAALGEGSSSNVIGFASSAYQDQGPDAGYYVEGHAVLNGSMAGTVFTFDQFRATFIHEFGHLIGLDHSQINYQYANNGSTADDEYIPTMYPTSVDDDVALGTLHVDDIVSLSRLYPSAGFASSTGSISGTVTRSDASVVRGANVIAISTSDSLSYQLSTVTDYFVQVTGNYTISGLAPGSYWIKIEPIRSAFTVGSSVGPYSESSSDLSFQNAVTTEFYNDASEGSDPATDDPLDKSSVVVSAGGTATASLVANAVGGSGSATTLQYYGNAQYVLELPSEYADMRYAVRFTPGISGKLQKVDFLLNNASGAVEGTGNLKVTVHQHTSGSIGGVPGVQVGSDVTTPFSALSVGVQNEVDLQTLDFAVSPNVDFHIAFEVVGSAGDTLQFLGDDAASETDRSSSYYEPPGQSIGWYNFKDPNNFGEGFNLFVRAFLSVTNGVSEESILLYPDGVGLGQNYPNPFNPRTVMPFRLESASQVSLVVYDVLGRQIRPILDNESMQAGDHTVAFDAFDLRSGMYVAVLRAGDRTFSRSLILIK